MNMRLFTTLLFLAIVLHILPIAGANVTIDPGTGQVLVSYNTSIGYSVSGELAPGEAFSSFLILDWASIAFPAPGDAPTDGAGISWGGLVRHYVNQSGNLTLVSEQEIGPGISDGYIYVTFTQTTTEYITQTITVTRTITSDDGTTKVVTEIRTVTIPVEDDSRIDPGTLGLGLFLILLIGLAVLRR